MGGGARCHGDAAPRLAIVVRCAHGRSRPTSGRPTTCTLSGAGLLAIVWADGSRLAALRRWILEPAGADVPLVEIAEAAGTTVERVQEVIARERVLAEERRATRMLAIHSERLHRYLGGGEGLARLAVYAASHPSQNLG